MFHKTRNLPFFDHLPSIKQDLFLLNLTIKIP